MNTEFYALNLSRFEALECLRALLLRAIVDEEVRSQKGLELPDINPMINRLIDMLDLKDDVVEKETDKQADELWEYSWYVFTSEWAWYRAQQDALKQLRKKKKTEIDYRAAAEMNFKKFFEKYVAELNMKPIVKSSRKPQEKRNSKSSSAF